MRSIAGTVLAAAAASALPSEFVARYADDNSLIPGRLDAPVWRIMRPGMSPSVRPFAAAGPSGLRELVAVNDGLCPYGGALLLPVTIPAGVSTVRLVLESVALQSGVADTAPLTLELRDSTGASVVVTTTYDPTGTQTDVTTSAVAVTAGAEYMVRLACNETGQSRFVCGRIRLEPVAVTDTFFSNFRRLDVSDANILDSAVTGYFDARHPRMSQFARFEIETDASQIVVQTYDTINDYVQNKGYSGVFVDGYPVATLVTDYGRINHETVSIPAGARRMKRVSVWAGPQATVLLPAPVPTTENIGTFPCAVYVPASAYVDIVRDSAPVAGRSITMLVDSKGSGFYSSNPGIDSIVPMLRRAGIRVVSVGAGGDTIYRYVGSTVSTDACLPLARLLVRNRPDEVVLQIGRNDWASSRYTPANLVTQIGNLADAIHQVDPRVLVTITTWTRENTENSVSGVTWNAERDAILAIPSTRSGWCRALDTAENWTSTDVLTYVNPSPDLVHLSDAGQYKYARHIVEARPQFSILQLSNLFSWHEFDYGLPGGAPGSVTATGTSPPTVTLSGTSTIAGRLRIEIKVAGARGIARFRWGIDDYGWAQSNVLTAATVTLPIGITINFSTGTSYPNNAVYTAPLQISSLPDRSGNGHHATALSTQYASFDAVAIGGKPCGLFSTTAPGDKYTVSGINIPAPYSVLAVAQIGTAGTRGIVCRSATGSGLLMYSKADGAAISVNDGPSTVEAPATMTQANCFVLRVNGASSSIRVNGAQTGVTLNNSTLLGYSIGCDSASSAFNFDKWIRRVVVCSGLISDGECRAFEALCRAELGTP